MDQINVHEAKTHLSRILARVEGGETVLLARHGKPVARIEPLTTPTTRELGFVDLVIPDGFFAPLADDELEAWER